jgi:regulator of protease activity HflC (stomatin/prohibitin superfamily)
LEPGVHFSLPFIDEVVQVSTSVKTNQITNVECGTGGIEISFPSIEIVSYLNKENAYEIVRDYTVEYD